MNRLCRSSKSNMRLTWATCIRNMLCLLLRSTLPQLSMTLQTSLLNLLLIDAKYKIVPNLTAFVTNFLFVCLFQASEVMGEFEKTVAHLKQQLLESEHRRHQLVRVCTHLGVCMCNSSQHKWHASIPFVTIAIPAMRMLQVRMGLSLCDVSQYHLCHTVSFQLCFLSGSRDKVSAGKRRAADQLWEKGSMYLLLQENWSTELHSFCRCIKTALDKVITVKWRSKPGVTCSFWFPLLSDFMSGLVNSELWLTGRRETGQRIKRRIYNLA